MSVNKTDSNHFRATMHGTPHEVTACAQDHDAIAHLLRAALDAISEAVVIVDSQLRVVFHNRAARRELSAEAGVSIDSQRLTLACPVDRAAIRAAVVAAVDAGRSTALRMHDPRGATSAFCRVLPLALHGAASRDVAKERLALIVCRSANVALEQIRVVCELFGLSHAECKVVELLARGANPQAIAKALGCSIHTVRAHLKQVFYKTNTARQSEFIALVRTAVP